MTDPNIEVKINKNDYPSNSHKKEKSKRQVEKVVTGNVVKQKKSFTKMALETFIGDNTKNVGDYIFYDVLIPRAKDMILDMVKGSFDIVRDGIEIILFGDKRRHNVNRHLGKSFVSYGSYFKSDDRKDRQEISRPSRARHNFDNIVLESKTEAEEVLSHLVDLIVDYEMATVADFYALVGISDDYVDQKYGWVDLHDAHVERARGGGYMIDLPKPYLLD